MDTSPTKVCPSSTQAPATQPDQVQAIYLAQANIFSYEARKSSKSWVPLCDSTVPISILYDATRSIYRIISVDADIKEVVVNTTIQDDLEFVKTTQKFGYWKDVSSGRVFGIGFASEYEAEAFDECLRKVKHNIKGVPSTSSVDTIPVEEQETASGPSVAPNLVHPVQKVNWDDYDQMVTLITGRSPRPMTYKVDIPPTPGLPPPSYYYPEPPPQSLLPLTIPHGFSYQGPSPGGGDTHISTEEISRLRNENLKLTESLMETTCCLKKMEIQVEAMEKDNTQLVKSMGELTAKMEVSAKEAREWKEQADRWKEHYQQVVTSAKKKSLAAEETEEKVKVLTGEKVRLELNLKEMEEELRKAKETQGLGCPGQFGSKYFKELEDHYRKLLSDSQKRIEEVLHKDGDRKNVLRGVDTLFTGAIQGLINIHGQIRQAYEQQ